MRVYLIALGSLLSLALPVTLAGCGPDGGPGEQNKDDMVLDEAAQRAAFQACVKETTTYTPFETSISTAARVGAFESIGERLWRNPTPTRADFEQANLLYVEEEGLDSRLSRREDEHYPAVEVDGETVSCNSAPIVAISNPERCVGPAQIRPLVIDGLTEGAMSEDQLVRDKASHQVEASLLWFLYVSTYKEIHTCAQKKKDCDSSYAYYTGAEPEEMGIGLAGYFRREVPEAHAAVWDALLKMRCWRQVDGGDTAANTPLRDEVIRELDAALLFGLSRLVTARLKALQESSDEAQRAELWQAITILGPVLEREAKARDSAQGVALAGELDEKAAEGADLDMLITLIEDLFPSTDPV